MTNGFAMWRGWVGVAMALAVAALPATAQEPIKIGHVAALSGASAQSGEAITRGLTIAIEEINAKGGLLGGRKLELIQRDDESVPPKGVVAARELISKEKVVAMFGGIDTPVALACVPVVNKEKVPYIAVWAAGTGITRNGADPNFVFRVSAVDVLVDVKLLDYASKKFGSKKPGLMLINNPWGASNEQGLVAADKDNPAVEIAGIEKFENNDVDMTPQLARLKEKGADSIILVVNTPPGAQMMKSRERMGWTVPVVSHWGISGGRFPELAGPTAGDAHFVQTYSFFGKLSPVGERVLAALKKKYPADQGARGRFRSRRHRQRLRCHAPPGPGDCPGRLDRWRQDPRGAGEPERKVRGPDQDLQQALLQERPRRAGGGRLHHGPLRRRQDRADAVGWVSAADTVRNAHWSIRA